MADEIKRIAGILAVGPKDKPGKEPGNGASAGENSGQLTAAIKDLVHDIQSDENDESKSNSSANLAAQFGGIVPDGITSWDFIRQNQPSGTGVYFSGEALGINCPNCASSAPEGSLQLYIDFGARTLGGGNAVGPSGLQGSFIHIHGVSTAGNSDTIQQRIGLGGSGLNPISFSSLSGPATIALNATNLGPVTTTLTVGGATGVFNGSSISLVNAGGVVAAKAQTNLVWAGTNNASAATNASGTFLSPR
jgi:hypothetical protein